MIINIILPYKDKFFSQNPSSISITVQKNLKYSSFKKNVKIFGCHLDDPAYSDNYIGIKKPINPFSSKNSHLAKKANDFITSSNNPKQIIEIHNRPYLIKYFQNNSSNYPIFLFLHNDPLGMKGSKSLRQRKEIISRVSKVFCVSEYIKERFLVDLKYCNEKVEVIHNGVDRNISKPPNKYKNILFVGKLTSEKGIDLFLDMSQELSKKYKDWFFEVVGDFPNKNYGHYKKYKNKIVNKINNIGEFIKFYGPLNYSKTQERFKKASIVIVPSIWAEPFGLVVAEAMSNGAAVVASYNGGIPEIVNKNGILLSNINAMKLTTTVESLILDDKKLKKYQKLSWHGFNFSSEKSSKLLDKKRCEVLLSHF